MSEPGPPWPGGEPGSASEWAGPPAPGAAAGPPAPPGPGAAYPPAGFPPGTAAPPAPREPWVTRRELRFAGLAIGSLVIVGVLLGLVWRLWASTPTRGLVYPHNAIVPDETEGFISSDGKFLVLTGLAGLVAGVVIWRQRDHRGPIAVLALAVGGLLGALATNLVGRLVGGGADTGKVNEVLPRLPLEVHATGLLLAEALLGLLVYLVCALFVSPDDLGRSTPAPPVSSQPAPVLDRQS